MVLIVITSTGSHSSFFDWNTWSSVLKNVRQVGKNHALFEVVLALNLVIVQQKKLLAKNLKTKRKTIEKKLVKKSKEKNNRGRRGRSQIHSVVFSVKCASEVHWKNTEQLRRTTHTHCTLQLIFTSICHFTNWNCANKPLNRLYCCCCYLGDGKWRRWVKWEFVCFLVNHQTFFAEAKSNFEVYSLPLLLLLPICCFSRVIAIENRPIKAIKVKNAL